MRKRLIPAGGETALFYRATGFARRGVMSFFGNLTAKQNERKRRLFLDAAPTRFYEASSDGISPDLIDIPTPKSSPRTPSLAHIVSKSRYADSECDNAP
jgi:hypothetical protein